MVNRRWSVFDKTRAVCLILVLSTASAAGCGARNVFEGDEMVPLEKIPAPVLEAAKKAIPGITFNKAWKSKIEGQDAYEIVGKTKDGKTREVEVSVTGTVLNIE